MESARSARVIDGCLVAPKAATSPSDLVTSRADLLADLPVKGGIEPYDELTFTGSTGGRTAAFAVITVLAGITPYSSPDTAERPAPHHPPPTDRTRCDSGHRVAQL